MEVVVMKDALTENKTSPFIEENKANPKVSWLICTNICNENLRLAIDSCITQSFTDFELILVVNGDNRDSIASTVKEWYVSEPRVKIYITHINYLTFSLSLGLHYCAGELIARMDADDISKYTRLESQVNYMNRFKDVDVLATDYELIDNNGIVVGVNRCPESDRDIRKALVFSNPICHPSVMFRKKIVTSIGGYMGGLHTEDYDLWTRLAIEANTKFASISVPHLQYRNSGSSARGSVNAYSWQAVYQFKLFLDGRGIIYLLASSISCGKLMLRKISLLCSGFRNS